VLRTIHLRTGEKIEVDDVAETKTTEKRRPDWSEVRDPESNCANTLLGASGAKLKLVRLETVAGYRAAVMGNGQITLWYAVDLGCAKIKTRDRGNTKGYSTKEATLIQKGEPDDALFWIPPSYKEVKPSVFYKLDSESVEGRRIDAAYLARQR
jgi:hypothetical protein